ncbi:MAG: transcriptional repressor [Amaricoccus sp.]
MEPSTHPEAQPEPEAFRTHDHGACRGQAMAAVAAACAARRLRLTPARAFVLETLLESHRALTAYELLERLAAAGHGSQPPVVYRALDFLLAHGFAHRIERLGAFVGCTHGGSAHAAAFLVCRLCRTVAETELPNSLSGLAAEAAAGGFEVESMVVEAEGLCARCRAANP